MYNIYGVVCLCVFKYSDCLMICEDLRRLYDRMTRKRISSLALTECSTRNQSKLRCLNF